MNSSFSVFPLSPVRLSLNLKITCLGSRGSALRGHCHSGCVRGSCTMLSTLQVAGPSSLWPPASLAPRDWWNVGDCLCVHPTTECCELLTCSEGKRGQEGRDRGSKTHPWRCGLTPEQTVSVLSTTPGESEVRWWSVSVFPLCQVVFSGFGKWNRYAPREACPPQCHCTPYRGTMLNKQESFYPANLQGAFLQGWVNTQQRLHDIFESREDGVILTRLIRQTQLSGLPVVGV